MPDRKKEKIISFTMTEENELVFNGSEAPEYISEATRLFNALKDAKANRSRCALSGTDEEYDKAKNDYLMALTAYSDFTSINA
jgi:hypothetical protein